MSRVWKFNESIFTSAGEAACVQGVSQGAAVNSIGRRVMKSNKLAVAIQNEMEAIRSKYRTHKALEQGSDLKTPGFREKRVFFHLHIWKFTNLSLLRRRIGIPVR